MLTIEKPSELQAKHVYVSACSLEELFLCPEGHCRDRSEPVVCMGGFWKEGRRWGIWKGEEGHHVPHACFGDRLDRNMGDGRIQACLLGRLYPLLTPAMPQYEPSSVFLFVNKQIQALT